MKNFYNFIIKFFELWKSDTITSIGKYLIGTGIVLLTGIGIFNVAYEGVAFQYSDEGNIIGYLFLLSGFIVIIYRTFTKKNTVTLVYGRGLENMNNHSPIEAIPPYLHFDCIEVNLKEINSYKRDKLIENFNFNKQLMADRILNKNSKKVYIGALGNLPYLFLLGSLFRNAYSEVITLDFNRYKSKWYKLPSFYEKEILITHKEISKKDKSIEEIILEFNDNDNNEVGIALGYTFATNKNAIPEVLKNNTLFLETSFDRGHDILSSEEVQTKLLKELSSYMASLWEGHDKIHLFVSAQSSMCINIGKNYMNNAHGVLVLYNYDNNLKSYNWNIEYDRGKIIL